jgi:hypothetical protein
MKKLLIATILLSSCKASDIAAPVSDAPTASTECDVKDSDFISANEMEIISCDPFISTIYAQTFTFNSDGTACGAVFDLDNQLISSNCSSRWERPNCSTVNFYGPSDSSLQSISSLEKTTEGFSTTITMTIGDEEMAPYSFNCKKLSY